MHYRRQHRGFTPEAIANARRRYEDTDEPQHSIAEDFGVHRKTLDRLAKEQGWRLRKDRARRALPPDLRLLMEAERAVRAEAEASVGQSPHPAGVAGHPPPQRGPRDANVAGCPSGEGNAPSIADRLERAVEKELAAVEIMRATLGPQPQPPADAERTARTLERLTDTLFKVRRLRVPEAHMTGSDDYDDMPGDIDEFRQTLARRIEAFVRNRTDGAVPPAGECSGTGPSQ